MPGIVIGVPSVPGLVAAPRVDSCDEPRTPSSRATHAGEAAVDLYWLPLGAGGYSVRLNGRAFEAIASRIGRRPACALYHSALEVQVDAERFVIEQAPVRDGRGEQRGVVAEGPVGSRWAGRLRIFRYEIRRWQDGCIPDIEEAAGGPLRVADDQARARRVRDLIAQVPTPVWGRDELTAGEMWNSNSVIAWLLTRSAIDAQAIHPPPAGRAPGWQAGIVIAQRQATKGQTAGAGGAVAGLPIATRSPG